MDSFGRVWDLRTGRCVMFLEGHLGPVLGVDWAPAGHQLATAAADHQVTYLTSDIVVDSSINTEHFEGSFLLSFY